jgi:hypothetical protein
MELFKYDSMGNISFTLYHKNKKPTREELITALQRRINLLESTFFAEVEKMIDVEDTVELEDWHDKDERLLLTNKYLREANRDPVVICKTCNWNGFKSQVDWMQEDRSVPASWKPVCPECNINVIWN